MMCSDVQPVPIFLIKFYFGFLSSLLLLLLMMETCHVNIVFAFKHNSTLIFIFYLVTYKTHLA